MLAALLNKAIRNNEIKIKETAVKDDQQLETFTASGVISEITEDFFIVESDGETFNIPRSDDKFSFMIGDEVEIEGFLREVGFADIFKDGRTIKPAKSLIESGRVTSIDSNFTIFNHRVVYFMNSSNDLKLKVNQGCEYEAIATDQNVAGKSYKWRVIEILEIMEQENIQRLVEMKSVEFSIEQSERNVIEKFISFENRSNTTVQLLNIFCDSSNQMMDSKKLYNDIMLQKGRAFKYYFTFFPRQIGEYKFKFVADFVAQHSKEKFQKSCFVDINVYDDKNIYFSERVSSAPRFKEIRIKSYPIPAELRTLNIKNVENAISKLNNFHPDCIDELSKENYIDKLHIGLYIEEIALETAFRDYRIERDRFLPDNSVEAGLYKLVVKDVAEKRPSISIGDRVIAKRLVEGEPLEEQVIPIGQIKKVGEDFVLLKFPHNIEKNFDDYEYMIDFDFSRTTFRNQHHSIDTVDSIFGLDFIFPNKFTSEPQHKQIHVDLVEGKLVESFKKEIDWFDEKLNNYQKEAVVNVLQGECRPSPYIIYGPPGTGKTMTVVEIIKQLHRDESFRLIVATPSNSAAYSLTDQLIQSGIDKKDLIRIISNNQLENGFVPDYLEAFCATVSADDGNKKNNIKLDEKGSDKIRKDLKKKDIETFRICVATLSSFGTLMQMKFKENHFSHIIVDEAGQAVEAQTLIPIALMSRGHCQIVLAGDPKQLGPPSVSMIGKYWKTDISMLERLLSSNECYSQSQGPDGKAYDPRFVTKLKINYRALPSILNVYNKLFYNSELQSTIGADGNSDAKLLQIIELKINKKITNCGIHFYNVAKGVNRREKDSSSWYNATEIKAIHAYLARLKQMKDVDIPFNEVGIITPYALQQQKLKKKLVNLPDADLKIGTVEEFQGQERQIILLSMVRTEEKYFNSDFKFNIGFVHCPKRINVTISRARSLLVIFGKADLLKNNPYWKHIIDYTSEHGTYFDDLRS